LFSRRFIPRLGVTTLAGVLQLQLIKLICPDCATVMIGNGHVWTLAQQVAAESPDRNPRCSLAWRCKGCDTMQRWRPPEQMSLLTETSRQRRLLK